MKTALVVASALVLLAVANARPQTSGSSIASATGLQGHNQQQLDLLAKVQSINNPTNGGFTASNNIALSTGVLVSGLGQQSSNLGTQTTSDQQTGPPVKFPRFPVGGFHHRG